MARDNKIKKIRDRNDNEQPNQFPPLSTYASMFVDGQHYGIFFSFIIPGFVLAAQIFCLLLFFQF